MGSKRKSRKTNPVIFVFCEGKTEEVYIDLLRSHFRVPIQIITKVLHTKISQRLVDAHLKNSGYPEIDKVFLFYDGDREDITQRLYEISKAEVALSCPCVELWYLLHFTEHHGALASDKLVKKLLKHNPEYQKGDINNQLRKILLGSWKDAAMRAKSLTPKTNPSTSVYILPEYLETIKKRNMP